MVEGRGGEGRGGEAFLFSCRGVKINSKIVVSVYGVCQSDLDIRL